MKIFIDFDDTIFDRERFAADLFEIFQRPGIDKDVPRLFSDDEVNQSYRAVYTAGYAGPEAQLRYMKQNYPDRDFDLDAALKQVSSLLERVKEGCIFPNAIEYIRSAKSRGDEVFLITVGGVDFQRSKVKISGVEELIGEDHCIYTTEPKEIALREYVDSDEEFILVEDKDDTIRGVSGSFQSARFVKAIRGRLTEI